MPSLKLLSSILLLSLLSACGDQSNSQTFQLSGHTMGTTYNITVVGKNTLEPTLIAIILENIENTMSSYRTDSELMQFNGAPINTWINTSQPLYEILQLSNELSQLSNGAFDITVAPLVNLWGFGPDKSNFGSPPSEEDINATIQNVGYQNLVFAEDGMTVLKIKMINLDLSAIAKGYAVDEISALLENNNILDYLVEIGGEISSKGRNAQGEPWRIAIEKPDRSGIIQNSIRTIEISGQSVASSGGYRNYYEVNGIYYSHTIDPRNGKPVNHGLASVTVLADSAALADALATAFNVMGVEQATLIANDNNIPAYFLSKTADGYSESYSTAFTFFINQN